MNFSQYVVAALIVQTVRSNTIGSRASSDASRTDDITDRRIGIREKGDSQDFGEKELIPYDAVRYPSNDVMTSSDFLQAITSPKFLSTPVLRVRRGSKSPRRKKCDLSPREKCKRNRRRGGKKRKCKKRTKKGRRKCKKTKPATRKPPKGPPINPKAPTITINSSITSLRSKCVRSRDCGEGYCCARHHYGKICKPILKLDDVCKRPSRKNRRNAVHVELCGCKSNLVCKKNDKEGRKNRLFTCQANT